MSHLGDVKPMVIALKQPMLVIRCHSRRESTAHLCLLQERTVLRDDPLLGVISNQHATLGLFCLLATLPHNLNKHSMVWDVFLQ